MIALKRYTPSDKLVWDSFLDNCKNATFLFKRDYVDYHADRFKDHSLFVFKEANLVAVFVASERNDRITCHEGLTYGGLVTSVECRQETVLSIFFHLCRYYHDNGFRQCLYKAIPFYYASFVSQEDLYPIFLLDGLLTRRDTSFVIELWRKQLEVSSRRMRAVRKAEREGAKIAKANSVVEFWNEVLEPNLQKKFGVKPVHTAGEMNSLMQHFPDNISQYLVMHSSAIVAGVTIFENKNTVHAQYISANTFGKEIGALDFLFHHLINERFSNKEYFSFGIANENQGKILNVGLAEWKEGFGARAFVHDFYQFNFSNYYLLKEYE